MNKTSIIHSNCLINKEDFVDSFFNKSKKYSQTPIIDIAETPKVYYIDIYFFSNKNHFLKLTYKNHFLVLEIYKTYANLNCSLKRIFYLKDVDLNKVSLSDFNSKIKLIIPKIT